MTTVIQLNKDFLEWYSNITNQELNRALNNLQHMANSIEGQKKINKYYQKFISINHEYSDTYHSHYHDSRYGSDDLV